MNPTAELLEQMLNAICRIAYALERIADHLDGGQEIVTPLSEADEEWLEYLDTNTD
ncbi:MAG: hypothetical protein GF364_22660 [Candidatus Lokiarchaeota archaeon]|nr:hypothetical protein [Candidatus Lokiarchaeota archaeon]